jgi:hypothetical protein
VREVAGVEAHAHHVAGAGGAQLAADRDRRGDPGLGVEGVAQERRRARHRGGVAAERLGVVAPVHHPRVGVGAAHRHAVELAGQHVGGGADAADPRRPRSRSRPPSRPWARRSPSSITGSPPAAATTRAALVAIKVEKFTSDKSGVSTSCAHRIGARTRISGSCANTSAPSGTTSTVPVKRWPRR